MTDETTHSDRVNRLLRAAFGQDNHAVVESVVEHVTGCEVVEMDGPRRGSEYEVWFGHPGAVTGDELDDVKRLFDVREMGVYGDRMLAGTEEDNGLQGRFHAILSVDLGDD